MIKAIMTNFAKTVYIGNSLDEAVQAVKRAGFEATVVDDSGVLAVFSPISGWRFV